MKRKNKIKSTINDLDTEVIKRLEENDLYIKPEKYKWKVREVEFLGVVIEPDGIKMEEEKMKGALNWPAPKCVKALVLVRMCRSS